MRSRGIPKPTREHCQLGASVRHPDNIGYKELPESYPRALSARPSAMFQNPTQGASFAIAL